MRLISIILITAFLSSGCATTSNRNKSLGLSFGVGVIGGTIGAANAPAYESKGAHFALWGGVSALCTLIASLFIFDSEKEIKKLHLQSDGLKRELDAYRGEGMNDSQLLSMHLSLEKELPEKYKGLIRPGAWKIYKIDNWISQSENTLIHQDQMIQIIPPSFRGNIQQKGE
jgi:multidrug transporter EmrE-like cation transporter